jgi:hypothetical protein
MRSKAPAEGESRTDGDGSRGPGIEHHQGGFLVDNVVRETVMTGNPYNVTLDTTQLSNGVRTLVAKATDSGGSTALSLPVNITVNNGGVAARNASADSVHTGLGTQRPWRMVRIAVHGGADRAAGERAGAGLLVRQYPNAHGEAGAGQQWLSYS